MLSVRSFAWMQCRAATHVSLALFAFGRASLHAVRDLACDRRLRDDGSVRKSNCRAATIAATISLPARVRA